MGHKLTHMGRRPAPANIPAQGPGHVQAQDHREGTRRRSVESRVPGRRRSTPTPFPDEAVFARMSASQPFVPSLAPHDDREREASVSQTVDPELAWPEGRASMDVRPLPVPAPREFEQLAARLAERGGDAIDTILLPGAPPGLTALRAAANIADIDWMVAFTRTVRSSNLDAALQLRLLRAPTRQGQSMLHLLCFLKPPPPATTEARSQHEFLRRFAREVVSSPGMTVADARLILDLPRIVNVARGQMHPAPAASVLLGIADAQAPASFRADLLGTHAEPLAQLLLNMPHELDAPWAVAMAEELRASAAMCEAAVLLEDGGAVHVCGPLGRFRDESTKAGLRADRVRWTGKRVLVECSTAKPFWQIGRLAMEVDEALRGTPSLRYSYLIPVESVTRHEPVAGGPSVPSRGEPAR